MGDKEKKIFDAISKNKFRLVKRLLKKGVDINSVDENGKSFLAKAVEIQNVKIVEVLVKANAVFSENIDQYKIEIDNKLYDNINRAKLLVKAGVRFNENDNGIAIALSNLLINWEKNGEEAHLLVEADAFLALDADIGRSTALVLSAEYGHFEILKSLIAKGVNVNQAGLDDSDNKIYALYVAIEKYHYDIVEYLLNHGARTDVGKTDALSVAINKSAYSIVELLLKHGVVVESYHLYMMPEEYEYSHDAESPFIEILEEYYKGSSFF